MAPDPNKPNRPIGSLFLQQKLPAWRPIITPIAVIIGFFITAIIFIPLGSFLLDSSNAVYELSTMYDGYEKVIDCSISGANQGRQCQISFQLTQDISEPLYVFYQLTSFYQSHRQYVQSRDSTQLEGKARTCDILKLSKDPVLKNGSIDLNPCGVIANSYFNDVFALNTPAHKMDETGISWQSDRLFKFGHPDGFTSQANPTNAVCDTLLGKTGAKSYTDKDGFNYCFWYPNDDTTQYLYETYPQISPLKGVTDEHFIVWMRTATTPTFRKLYGRILGDFKKNEILTFNVTANFEVNSLQSTKTLILTTRGEFGSKNKHLGVTYIVVGVLSLVGSICFAIKHFYFPTPDRTLPEDWLNN